MFFQPIIIYIFANWHQWKYATLAINSSCLQCTHGLVWHWRKPKRVMVPWQSYMFWSYEEEIFKQICGIYFAVDIMSAADRVVNQVISVCQTSITNFLLFLEYQHALVSQPCTVSLPHVSPSTSPPTTLQCPFEEVHLTVKNLWSFPTTRPGLN